MKRLTSIIAGVALLAASGIAAATSGQLAPVTVHQDRLAFSDCTPPNDSVECADLHAAIRRNFSTREIGMLFGAATSYQEYPTAYSRVRERYAAFLQRVEETGTAVAVAAR